MKAIDLHINREPEIYLSPNLPKSPMVSICVTTYNHSLFVERCLQSILSQKTTFDFEVLLGEDDSSDGTRDICKRIAQQFPNRVKLFLHHRENVMSILGRPTGRFNFLWNLNEARGKYIALCDGDDYWTDPFKLQKQIDILESDILLSISCHNTKEIGGSGRSADTDSMEVGRYTIHDLSRGNFIYTSSCVFRRPEHYPDWFLTVAVGDYPLHMLNAQKGGIHYSNESMSVYRKHKGGIWSSLSSKEMKLKWVHLLITLYSHFDEDVRFGLEGQIKTIMAELLKDSHVALDNIKPDTLSHILESSNMVAHARLLKSVEAEALINHFHKSNLLEVDWISHSVKWKILVKALLKKVLVKFTSRLKKYI